MLQVVVVGGGPAGLIAAEALAAAGIATTVLEAHPDRLLPCAGVLSHRTLKAIGAPELLAHRIKEAAIYAPSQRVAFVGFGDGTTQAGAMNRELLQTLLRRRAEEAGVTFVHGRFRRFVHGVGDYPQLAYTTPDGGTGHLSGDVVIGADGVHSRVARVLGLPALPLGVAYMEKLSARPAAAAPARPLEVMQIHLGRKVSPDRYGWMIPQLEHLTLGVATSARYGKRVWDMLAEVKRRMGAQLDGSRSLGREAFTFPLATRPVLAHERVLLVGDAAGLAPAAFMDGLHYAVASGRLAAETIIANRNMPTPERLVEYEQAFKAAYADVLDGAQRFEQTFFQNDRRREALVDMAQERDAQRVAVQAFLDKTPIALPLRASLKLRTRLVTSLLRHSLIASRRADGPVVERALPAGGNYLDMALLDREEGTLSTLPPLREMLVPRGADEPAGVAPRGDEA